MNLKALRTRIGLAVCVGAWALASGGGLAHGQATRPAAASHTPEISFDSAEEAVAALAVGQWAVRDAAQRWLMKQPAEDRETVERALLKTSDPEVEARLFAVALHLYLKADTPFQGEVGLLGVALSPEPQEAEKDGRIPVRIAVMSMLPGFPAAEVLQSGDRIIALNGTRILVTPANGVELNPDEVGGTAVDKFRTAVNYNRPGTTVKLTIERAGVMRDVRVKLAGVVEAGPEALKDFVNQRNARAAVYEQMLHEKKDGVVNESIGKLPQE